jgi:hypothetical protein
MILGIPIVLITAVAVYMVVTVIITEYLKKYLYVVDRRNNKHSLMLSWIVGFFIYLLIFLFRIEGVTFSSFMLFVVITGLLNTGYKFTALKDWIRKLLK